MIDALARDNWVCGRLLAFSAVDGKTDYHNGLVLRTTEVSGRPCLQAVIPGKGNIVFPGSCRVANRVTGDSLRIETAEGGVKGALLDAGHLLIEGPCSVSNSDAAIRCLASGGRTLIGSAARFAPELINTDIDEAIDRRTAWLRLRQSPYDLPQRERSTLAGMLSLMKTQVYSPEGRIRHYWTTPDRWPHRKMWLWDSVFHAAGWRHLDSGLAADMIAAVLDCQREDGFVPHMMSPDGISEHTQPPLLALGVKLVEELSPDRRRLAAIYPRLSAYIEWDLAHCDSDGAGLLEWALSDSPVCRGGESGMDNSPRFDAVNRLDAVDFNSYLALECEILAAFAEQLELSADADKWSSRYRRLCSLIADRLWSEKHGFFVDYDVERNEHSPVLAGSGFLPLLCGAASGEQAAKLKSQLRDPGMFATAFPVPTVAVGDSGHYAKDMWRGPTWINLNWLIARGFERYGMVDVAARIRRRTMREIESRYEQFGVAFEFYDDRCEVPPPQLLRKEKCDPEINPLHQVFHDFGWTATLYVDMFHDMRR